MSLLGGPGGFEPGDGDHDLCGVYYAIVTQNKDDRELARVKVRFPWMPGGDVDQSHWAALCVPMAGDEFGTYVLPEIDDTVLVVFIAGDIRYPVVIGGAWSEVDTPPEVNEDGKNDFRLIKSRSGHRLLLDDSSSGKLVLSSKTDKEVLSVGNQDAGGASDQNKYGVGGPPAAGSAKKKGMSLGSESGKMTVLCPGGTLKVEGQNVEITSSGKLDIKAGTDLKVEGSASATFNSSAPSNYEGGTTNIG
jgi:uncharacterized protein involved in type VI secretion and phage assembly